MIIIMILNDLISIYIIEIIMYILIDMMVVIEGLSRNERLFHIYFIL